MLTVLQALAYYYMRVLIYRPAVCSNLGSKGATAVIAVGESSKSIIQIIQLLEERSMSFSFCLNKADTLMLCGMSLLCQTIGLKRESPILKDNEKLVNSVAKILDKTKAPGSIDFKRIAALLITVDEPAPQSLPTPPRQSPEAYVAAPPTYRTTPPTPRRTSSSLGLHTGASVSETDLLLQQEKLRRMTNPQQQHHHQYQAAEQYRVRARQSFDGPPRTDALGSSRRGGDHRLSMSHLQTAMMARPPSKQHLDYLSLQSTPPSQPASPVQARAQQQQRQAQQAQQSQLYDAIPRNGAPPGVSAVEWESLLGSIETGQLNIFDGLYGNLAGGGLAETPTTTTGSWSPESWDLSGFNLGDYGRGSVTTLSMSEESLSSTGGEDMDVGQGGLGNLDYGGGVLAVGGPGDWEGLDGFGL